MLFGAGEAFLAVETRDQEGEPWEKLPSALGSGFALML